MNTTATPKKRRTPGAPAGHERMATMSPRIGFSPSTIYSWIANPEMGFPAAIKLTRNVSIFSIAVVDQWMAAHGLAPAQGAV